LHYQPGDDRTIQDIQNDKWLFGIIEFAGVFLANTHFIQRTEVGQLIKTKIRANNCEGSVHFWIKH